MSPSDARRAGQQLGALACHFLSHGDSLTDERLIQQLHHAEVNSAVRVDGLAWDDPIGVGQAFGRAKSALTQAAMKTPEADPEVDPKPAAKAVPKRKSRKASG